MPHALNAAAPSSPRRPAPAPVVHGAALTFETLGPAAGEPAPLRIQPWEDTLLRVIDGIVSLVVDGEEKLLAAGDEARIPAGAAHRLAGEGGEARTVMGFQAARRRR